MIWHATLSYSTSDTVGQSYRSLTGCYIIPLVALHHGVKLIPATSRVLVTILVSTALRQEIVVNVFFLTEIKLLKINLLNLACSIGWYIWLRGTSARPSIHRSDIWQNNMTYIYRVHEHCTCRYFFFYSINLLKKMLNYQKALKKNVWNRLLNVWSIYISLF